MWGVILHELGERFNSPTVNLFFGAEDYIKFLEKLDYYLGQTLVETQSDKDYPVAKLDDITIYFMHYPSFDEAKRIWEKRTERITDGINGYLCDPFDEDAFAWAINKLADASLRKSMAENCEKAAEPFDVEHSKKAMQDIYFEMLN